MPKIYLPLDICNMIADYIPKYVLHDWISINKLNWIPLSSNPFAVELLKENQNKIDWGWLSRNPAIFKPVRDQAILDVLYLL